MSAQVYTYAGLITAITQWANRTDTVFLSNIPLFISLTEQEIFIKLSTIGNEQYVTATFTPNNAIVPKPSLWGRTSRISYIDSVGKLHVLTRSSVPYIETDNPDTINSSVDLPRYYTDYGFPYMLISPTPTDAFNFVWSYFEKVPPLTDENQTNWNTLNAYDILFSGAMEKACIFISSEDKSFWASKYADGIASYANYDKRRLSDTYISVENE